MQIGDEDIKSAKDSKKIEEMIKKDTKKELAKKSDKKSEKKNKDKKKEGKPAKKNWDWYAKVKCRFNDVYRTKSIYILYLFKRKKNILTTLH